MALVAGGGGGVAPRLSKGWLREAGEGGMSPPREEDGVPEVSSFMVATCISRSDTILLRKKMETRVKQQKQTNKHGRRQRGNTKQKQQRKKKA